MRGVERATISNEYVNATILCSALLVGAFGIAPALAEPMPLQADRYNATGSVRRAPGYIAPAQQPAPRARYASADQSQMGGGFIEFLFGGGQPSRRRARPARSMRTPASRHSCRMRWSTRAVSRSIRNS